MYLFIRIFESKHGACQVVPVLPHWDPLSFEGRGNGLQLLLEEARFWKCKQNWEYCCGCFWNMQFFTEDFGGGRSLYSVNVWQRKESQLGMVGGEAGMLIKGPASGKALKTKLRNSDLMGGITEDFWAGIVFKIRGEKNLFTLDQAGVC